LFKYLTRRNNKIKVRREESGRHPRKEKQALKPYCAHSASSKVAHMVIREGGKKKNQNRPSENLLHHTTPQFAHHTVVQLPSMQTTAAVWVKEDLVRHVKVNKD